MLKVNATRMTTTPIPTAEISEIETPIEKASGTRIRTPKFPSIKTRTGAELLLAAVILARSTSFVMTKVGLEHMGTFTLLASRFLIAFIFLLPVAWKYRQHFHRSTLIRGMLLGGAFFCVMAAEVTGLRTTEASTVAFLENTAIVFVPLFESTIRRKLPGCSVVLSSLLALIGVALLTMKGSSLSLTTGELFCLTAAMLYGLSIILTDRLSRMEHPIALGILQVGFMGLYSLVAATVAERPRLPETTAEWGVILTLAIVCSGFGFTLQPLAQRGTTSERAGLFCALSPASAAILGSLFLNEGLGLAGGIGMAMILMSMLATKIMEVLNKKETCNEKRKADPLLEG